MKTLTQSTILCALALLAACQSSGHSAVDKTSTRMQELRTDIEKLKLRVTSNASSLVTLV